MHLDAGIPAGRDGRMLCRYPGVFSEEEMGVEIRVLRRAIGH